MRCSRCSRQWYIGGEIGYRGGWGGLDMVGVFSFLNGLSKGVHECNGDPICIARQGIWD